MRATATLVRAIIGGTLLALSVALSGHSAQPLPHLLVLVADDLGTADVGYRGAEIPTPHLDRLAAEAVRLTNYHVLHYCTPFRSALLTGRYPMRYGLQNEVIRPAEPNGLPINETLLPEVLRSYGYHSHMIGKWHIGHHTWAHTPMQRGFESFFGLFLSDGDYYEHTRQSAAFDPPLFGYDFRRGNGVAWEDRGLYANDVFVREARRVIAAHPADEPLFLYVAFQSPHFPMQVPSDYVDDTSCAQVPNLQRRTYCGMVAALDDAIGKIVMAMQEKGLWDNTLTLFTNDNGGDQAFGGINLPFRGHKSTLFEGGVRGIGFVHGALLGRSDVDVHGLIHGTDWFPTFEKLIARLAKSDPKDGLTKERFPFDGIDIWDHLTTDERLPRDTLLLNLDQLHGTKGLISGPYKYMVEINDPFYLVPDANDSAPVVTMPDGLPTGLEGPDGELFEWIFNLEMDPLEQINLAFSEPELLQQLRALMAQYESEAVPPGKKPETIDADPANFGGAWTPWVVEPLSVCTGL